MRKIISLTKAKGTNAGLEQLEIRTAGFRREDVNIHIAVPLSKMHVSRGKVSSSFITLRRSLGTDKVIEDGFGYDLLKLRRNFSLLPFYILS